MKLLFIACLLLVTSMAQAQRCETLLEKNWKFRKENFECGHFLCFL